MQLEAVLETARRAEEAVAMGDGDHDDERERFIQIQKVGERPTHIRTHPPPLLLLRTFMVADDRC